MTYSEIVSSGAILSKKELYTWADVEKLVKQGKDRRTASFICVCSAAFHDTDYSNRIRDYRHDIGTERELLY